jgi:hypothetical protein
LLLILGSHRTVTRALRPARDLAPSVPGIPRAVLGHRLQARSLLLEMADLHLAVPVFPLSVSYLLPRVPDFPPGMLGLPATVPRRPPEVLDLLLSVSCLLPKVPDLPPGLLCLPATAPPCILSAEADLQPAVVRVGGGRSRARSGGRSHR